MESWIEEVSRNYYFCKAEIITKWYTDQRGFRESYISQGPWKEVDAREYYENRKYCKRIISNGWGFLYRNYKYMKFKRK